LLINQKIAVIGALENVLLSIICCASMIDFFICYQLIFKSNLIPSISSSFCQACCVEVCLTVAQYKFHMCSNIFHKVKWCLYSILTGVNAIVCCYGLSSCRTYVIKQNKNSCTFSFRLLEWLVNSMQSSLLNF